MHAHLPHAEATFPAVPTAPAQARHWLGALLPDGTREAAMLAVSEIVTNALLHSRLDSADAITVQVAPAGERVRVRVRHRGQPFSTTPATKPGAQGGWGLHLVAAAAAAWGLQPGSEDDVVIWFEV